MLLGEILPSPTATVLTENSRTRTVDMVISMYRPATARLLRRMRRHRVTPAFSYPWGSEQACLALLSGECSLVVLDVPEGVSGTDLVGSVRLLSDFTTVVVLTPGHADSVGLLRAGAVNVLPRDLPSVELAGRFAAELRRIALSGPVTGRPTPLALRRVPGVKQTSQRTLLHLLSAAPRPLCCHEVRLLLSDAAHPMSRRALQSRTSRLNERLAQHGMRLRNTSQWGRTIYTGIAEAAG